MLFGIRVRRLGTAVLLLLGSNAVSSVASAAPSVDISLNIPWTESSPYLLEVVETLATEIPEAYFPLLTHLVEYSNQKLEACEEDPTAKCTISHKDIYDEAFVYAVSEKLLPESGTGRQVDFANLKLALRHSAPLIQAYYQFYNSFVYPQYADQLAKKGCDRGSWFWYDNSVGCDPGEIFALQTPSTIVDPKTLPFDRQIPDEPESSVPTAVLYADVTDPKFLAFHSLLSAEAEKGKLRYIIRYKPSDPETAASFPLRPKGLAGYGVELALKRTDYIVIDDRDKTVDGDKKSDAAIEQQQQEEDTGNLFSVSDTKDISPLKSYEVEDIGLQTAGYILQSAREGKNPLEVLLKIVEDFPKLASSIAAASVDNLADIRSEIYDNLQTMAGRTRFTHGDNALFANGARIDSQVSDDIFEILKIIEREYEFVDDLNYLGLSNEVASKMICSPTILNMKERQSDPRFDYRDDIEGGGVIVWLNDLEKDKAYAKFSPSISRILEPHYPGQFHQIQKNIHTIVVPVDLSSEEDIFLVTRNLKSFISRGLAVRFGIVPLVETDDQIDAAAYFYHVASQNVEFALQFFDNILAGGSRPPVASKRSKKNTASEDAVDKAAAWAKRLDVETDDPIAFGNGFAIARADSSWIQSIAFKLDSDIGLIQTLVKSKAIDDGTNIQDLLLRVSSARRSKLIFPEDPASVELLAYVPLYQSFGSDLSQLPSITYKVSEQTEMNKNMDLTLLVVADFDSQAGIKLFRGVLQFIVSKPLFNFKVKFIHNPGLEKNSPSLSTLIHYMWGLDVLSRLDPQEILDSIQDEATEDFAKLPHIEETYKQQGNIKLEGWSVPDNAGAFKYWNSMAPIVKALGLASGEGLVALNSRVIRLSATEHLDAYDFDSLLKYELSARLAPTVSAATKFGVYDLSTGAYDSFDFTAQLTSAVALSDRVDTPGGAFYGVVRRNSRVGEFAHELSAFDFGHDYGSAAVKIDAIVNPASEFAQKYVPILKVLGELEGVAVRVFMNPMLMISEMPVKRFYRNAIAAAPEFDSETGAIVVPETVFKGIPSDTLLTLGMDVPGAWVVTPSVSKYDLDNIILASVSEPRLEAEYILKKILVQGHVRESAARGSGGATPAGLQLTLGTEAEQQLEDTIVMANLGYLQFKSEPGVWKLGIKPGISQKIFKLDSVGALASSPQNGEGEGDDSVYVTSFSGVRLYPRVSRNEGQEEASVYGDLEDNEGGLMGQVQGQMRKAFGSILSKSSDIKSLKPSSQAAINIFSVASGHLYERFLNIMFVSVMRHTNETVKFWLIEDFLSPSFKEFLPFMAEEYKFEYELITYKWPHWLRAQKEKQRIIWGYKILFLDVMFPLDLEKVIFVDADQIVRTDLKELVDLDLHGAPYGYTPMCDSRTEMEGFRFWKQGYWKNFLRDKPYHISALYVIDLTRFRKLAAGDRLRQQYHTLSADPGSLSNLDQDLPNNMQNSIPIYSLPQDWLWCETWCSDESLATAKTIDLCNNPMTKEPKLDRARRQVPEWTVYDNEIAALAKRVKSGSAVVGGEVEKQPEAEVPETEMEHDEL